MLLVNFVFVKCILVITVFIPLLVPLHKVKLNHTGVIHLGCVHSIACPTSQGKAEPHELDCVHSIACQYVTFHPGCVRSVTCHTSS